MKIKLCLHQWLRSEEFFYFQREGWGDCRVCSPHEANKNCRGYCPITVAIYAVAEREEKDE